jgi:hypothetical protein
MMQQLINYIFVLSTLYLLVFIFDVILKLRENNPVPIKRPATGSARDKEMEETLRKLREMSK